MKLLRFTSLGQGKQFFLMHRAYEGDKMRQTAFFLGYEPVVPPKKNRSKPWDYDQELYKRRNEVDRFFAALSVLGVSLLATTSLMSSSQLLFCLL